MGSEENRNEGEAAVPERVNLSGQQNHGPPGQEQERDTGSGQSVSGAPPQALPHAPK